MNNYYLRKAELFNEELQNLLTKYGYELQDLVGLSVVISQKHDKPAIFLRRNTTDPEIIKRVIKAAYHNQPLIIMPQFTNTLQSLSSAVEKGILYKEGGQYMFTF